MELFNSKSFSNYMLGLFNKDTKKNRDAIAQAFGGSSWENLHEKFGETPYKNVQEFYSKHKKMISDYLSEQQDLKWNDLIKFFRDQKDYVIVADLGTPHGRFSSSLIKHGLDNAIKSCVDKKTISFEVVAKRKAIHITAHKRNGTNYFKIFFCEPTYLNSKALEKYQDDLYHQVKSKRPTCLKTSVLTDEMMKSLGLQ